MNRLTYSLIVCGLFSTGAWGDECSDARATLEAEILRVGVFQEGATTADALEQSKVRWLARSARNFADAGATEKCVRTVAEARAFINAIARPVTMSAGQLLGQTVVDASGREIGEVGDVVFDMIEGVAAYALVEFGGFLGLGEELIPVPFSALRLAEDGERLQLTDDTKRLELAPRFSQDSLIGMANRRWSRSVYAFYGEDPYWSGRAGLSGEKVGEQRDDVSDSGERADDVVSRRGDIRVDPADLEEQIVLTRKIASDVTELRATDEVASRHEMLSVMRDLKRQMRDVGELLNRQQAKATARADEIEPTTISESTVGVARQEESATTENGSGASNSGEVIPANVSTAAATSGPVNPEQMHREKRDIGEAAGGGAVRMPEDWGSSELVEPEDSAAAAPGSLEALFERLDADANGLVNENEAKTEFVVYSQFASLDANEDARVDRSEFEAMRSMSPRFADDGSLLSVEQAPGGN